MLMDDRLVALNAVIGHCRELAELYRGDRTGVDAEAQSLFERCGEDYDAFADQLAGQVRAMGELPAEEDPERLGVERFAVDLKSLFSARRDASLAETFDGIEDQLEQAVADALKHELPDGLAESLARLRTLISQHRDSLGDLSR